MTLLIRDSVGEHALATFHSVRIQEAPKVVQTGREFGVIHTRKLHPLQIGGTLHLRWNKVPRETLDQILTHYETHGRQVFPLRLFLQFDGVRVQYDKAPQYTLGHGGQTARLTVTLRAVRGLTQPVIDEILR